MNANHQESCGLCHRAPCVCDWTSDAFRGAPTSAEDWATLASVRTLIAALDGITRDIVITEHGVTLQDGGPRFGENPWDGIAKAAAWVRASQPTKRSP